MGRTDKNKAVKNSEARHRLAGGDMAVENPKTLPVVNSMRGVEVERGLRRRGIDYKNPLVEATTWLPLEAFDDTEYDCRTNEEWIRLGFDAKGDFLPLLASGLRRLGDVQGSWHACYVHGYDKQDQRFEVKWADRASSQMPNPIDKLHRLYLCFDAENVEIFTERVAAAHAGRHLAEKMIRYNFYVDNMPVHDAPTMDLKIVPRLLASALSTKEIRGEVDGLGAEAILDDIHKDYARTMNQVIFDQQILFGDEDEPMYKELQDLVHHGVIKGVGAQEDVPPPQQGLVPIPNHNFAEHFRDFCFSTLYIKPEVVFALHKIRESCNRVINEECLYVFSFSKAARLDEFRQIERSMMSQTTSSLKDNWLMVLHRIIQREFDGVSATWFNLQEIDLEVYEKSKLKKFLSLVRLIMQDTIRFLAMKSVEMYTSGIAKYVPKTVTVEDIDCVTNEYVSDLPKDIEYKVRPLFVLEMSYTETPEPKNREFIYSTDPHQLIDAVLDAYDRGITSLSDIPQLERLVMPHLFRTQGYRLVLAAPAENEPWVVNSRAQLEQRLYSCLPCLGDYLQKYSNKHLSLLRLEPENYVAEIDSRDPPVEDAKIRKLIVEELEQEQEVNDHIPESVQVGIVLVNCKELRKRLCEKHTKVAQLLLHLLSRRLRQQMDKTVNSFQDIYTQMRQAPKNIEELTEIKRFIDGVPVQVTALQNEIEKNVDLFDALETFQFKLPQEDHFQRWRMCGAPKATYDLMNQTTAALDRDEDEFLNGMVAQQKTFDDTLNEIDEIVANFHQYKELSKYHEVAEEVEHVDSRLTNAAANAKLFNSREALFGKAVSDYSRVQRIQREFEPYSNLWLTAAGWLVNKERWHDGPFGDIDPALVEREVYNGVKLLFKVCRYFREQQQNEMLNIAEQIRAELEEFRPYVPLVVGLRTEGLRERHWKEISNRVKQDIGPNMPNFTLVTLLGTNYRLQDHKEFVEIVADRASKEYAIEMSLAQMKDQWERQVFDCGDVYRTTGTYILKGFDAVSVLLDEHVVMTQSMQFSPFKQPFAKEIDDWSEQLVMMSETLDEWLKCQRAWLYLQPIFDAPDIAKKLPTEAKRFKSSDVIWRSVMKQTHENPHALTALSREGLLDRWIEINRSMESVQKGLEDYLETKRGIFSRFYFLSNDELLEILSQTKDPTRVQPFLKKVFENIGQLTFRQDLSVTAMHSTDGEEIPFVETLSVREKPVEAWMGDVERAMFKGIRHVLVTAIEAYGGADRNVWVQAHAAQAVLNGSQVHWTSDVEDALGRENGIMLFFKEQGEQLMSTVTLVRSGLSKQRLTAIGALIVLDVHQKDVVESLHKGKVDGVRAFEWVSQMRYYWEAESRAGRENLWVKCAETSFPYGYEYLGNTSRLVITPLTDQCYMTLMGAQLLNLGGAPAGPAGTGKTETTKDLAKAVARHCVVFNCSDGMDYIMVGKFFKGLAASGSWCCFDEFNRINVEVLSVIAQQLLVLFGAKAGLQGFSDMKDVEFEGSVFSMRPTFNVFITMNPGYAGRTELPDNLKALFRPVAMMVPDYALIGEIMLYSFGFQSARELAKKMVVTFRLSSEQLSSQDHYDYGMRAVRSVINAAGLLKRAEPATSKGGSSEAQLLLRALRDVNIPKFLKGDLPLFENIIFDLFPGIQKPNVDRKILMKGIVGQCKQAKLQPVETFQNKVVQLYDTIQVRHGLMLVGPAGGGKTSAYRTLQHAMSASAGQEDFKLVTVHALNPKSVTLGQLYGAFDEDTHEWTDGILASTIRTAVRDTSDRKHWVMFDGPVDAIWIESMNTVLDDNKKLCLNSGEIVQLTAEMTIMFEVGNLSTASPATVSRCGMVYMEPSALGCSPLVDSWLSNLPSTFKELQRRKIAHLCSTFLQKAITFVREGDLKEIFPTTDVQLCSSFLALLDCYCDPFRPTEVRVPTSDEIQEFGLHVDQIFIFCLLWSVGASVDAKGRKAFNEAVWNWLPGTGVTLRGLRDVCQLYDLAYVIEEGTGRWINWMKTVPEFQITGNDAAFHTVVVPTVDSIRTIHVVRKLLMSNKHVMVPGPTGTGKSVNVGRLMSNDMPDKFMSVFATFSAQTHVNETQNLLDSKFDKRRRGVYGPPAGKQCIIFVDDLNMPKKEQYGAQPPLELLRQWFDYGGWFNRQELTFNSIVDVTMAAAMGPPGGGRQQISARLSRHYNCLATPELMEQSVTKIFEILTSHFLKPFPTPIQEMVQRLVPVTMEVFYQVKGELLPTPTKTHYTFNLRDVWRIFQGVCSISSKISEPKQLMRCWVHENLRVFGDRFVCKEDREWLQQELIEKCDSRFGIRKDAVLPKNDRLIFGAFMKEEEGYQEITELDQMQEFLENHLEEYNGIHHTSPMPLVMFLDACEHVARICRVLRVPQGNCLLLGVGGSGRQSLARLSSSCVEKECFQIEVAKGYDQKEWREDVRVCLMKSGVEDKSQSFLFCDMQIQYEGMVEDINNVLNSGDVPNLYKHEDMEIIMQNCTGPCHAAGFTPTRANVFNCYLGRVQKNIHMILAFSPISEVFRTRLRMFPSLVNCCTIDWFSEWPEEALFSVATQQLQQNDLLAPSNPDDPNLAIKVDKSKDPKDQVGQAMGQAIASNLVTMFPKVHLSVELAAKQFFRELRRHYYVTPTSYLELIHLYTTILKNKRKVNLQQQSRFQKGVDKLDDAATQVEKMRTQLEDMQPKLEKTQKEAGEMMIRIDKDKMEADMVKEVVGRQEIEAQAQAAECQAIKDDAQRDLSEALPALDQATDCLKKLKADHVREIKAFGRPPPGVLLTMEAVCVMFGVPPVKKPGERPGTKIDDYWDAAQKELLKDPKKLLDDLMSYDKDNISDAVIKKITQYVDSDAFQPQHIKKSSVACEAICMWVRAMYTYHEIAKQVAPKRVKLQEAEEQYEGTAMKLKEAQDNLNMAVKKVQVLEDEYADAVAKKEQLEQQIEDCQVKMDRAGKLIGGLGGERVRWTRMVGQLGEMIKLLPGDCLICAGMVAHGGTFTSSYREDLEKEWVNGLDELQTRHSINCSLRELLGTPVKIQQWTVCGLPQDRISVENGIIIESTRRWPVLIDPQGQANAFLKSLGKTNREGFDVCKQSQPGFLRTLELGIQFGKWVILEGVGETLESALDPVLTQQKVKEGTGFAIRFSDKQVTWMDSFRLFMTTKLQNPHYSPELCVKVTLVNFSITAEGLEEQMLALVVAQESPDLEEKKSALVASSAKMREELQKKEDSILVLLSSSDGNILEDETLIETLASSKRTTEDMNGKIYEQEETNRDIVKARSQYQPVAFHAAALFFAVLEIADIDPMYQFSLQWFQDLFVMSMDEAAGAVELKERLENLCDSFSSKLHDSVCRALFEEHKHLFSFALCLKLELAHKRIDPAEARFLVSGLTVEIEPRYINPDPTIISEKEWMELSYMCDHFAAFHGLDKHLQSNPHELADWMEASNALEKSLPEPYDQNLTQFQQLLFVRAIRMDCLERGILDFVASTMGSQFIDPPTFNLRRSFGDSGPLTPLILILSSGSDPVGDVLAFADEMEMTKKLESISLGQGQGPKAQRLIEEATSRGGWVLLCNCHLCSSWMPQLEQLFESLSPSTVNQDFRLWLTSAPSKAFPTSILQTGVKITNAPPKGIRSNLLRTFSNLDDSALEGCRAPEEFHRLHFGFCFFHALIIERRRFGPIGWNIPYEFTAEDLAVCRRQLRMFLDAAADREGDLVVPYKVLSYLGAQINYGGRVTDDKDKRLIKTMIERFICPSIVEQGAAYKFSPNGVYFCPMASDREKFIDYISELPTSSDPEIFGLHENARIAFQKEEAIELTQGIMTMTSGSHGSGGAEEDELLGEAKILKERTPELFDLAHCTEKYPMIYSQSMNTVLCQEVARYNCLLQKMHVSLAEFEKALQGLVVMSDELEKMGQSVSKGIVPTMWADVGFLSLKTLPSWIRDLNDRVTFLSEWIRKGEPIAIWMSGFFFPQGFMSGVLQNYARRHSLPIDKAVFNFQMLDVVESADEILEGPDDGCFVEGIFLEGAMYNKTSRTLEASRPKELFTHAPIIWFVPAKDRRLPLGVTRAYDCPLYKVVSRAGTLSTTGHSTNFVISLDIPATKEPLEHWICAGVAAFLSLKD